jgi:ribonuclease Z
MTFEVTYLGVQAALPHNGGITTAQLANVHDNLYLLDCGEGTQMKLAQWGIRRNKMGVVLISHLHGDHIFGLPGLITSFSHFQRTAPLRIIGPPGLRQWIGISLKVSEAYIGFPLEIQEIGHDGMEVVFEDQHVRVSAFPLVHRIRCYGYRLDEKVSLNMRREKIEEYGLTHEQIRQARAQKDVNVADGKKVPWTELVHQKYVSRSYVFCTDTAYYPEIVPWISGADALYHEATYLADMQSQATERMHSTSIEAGKIAQAAGIGHLVLGHYSSRYGNVEAFAEEAGQFVPRVTAAREGLVLALPQERTDQNLH